MRDDELMRSGLAFGWIEEAAPRPTVRRYWIAAATLVLLVGAAVFAIAWWFR